MVVLLADVWRRGGRLGGVGSSEAPAGSGGGRLLTLLLSVSDFHYNAHQYYLKTLSRSFISPSFLSPVDSRYSHSPLHDKAVILFLFLFCLIRHGIIFKSTTQSIVNASVLFY